MPYGGTQHCSFTVISICHLEYPYTCQMQKRGPERTWGMRKRKLIVSVTMYSILMWNRTSVIFQGACIHICIHIWRKAVGNKPLTSKCVWLKRILIKFETRTAGTLIAVILSSGCLFLDHFCSCFYLLVRSSFRFEEPLAVKVNISSSLVL